MAVFNSYLRKMITNPRHTDGYIPQSEAEFKDVQKVHPWKIWVCSTKEQKEKIILAAQNWPSINDFIMEAAINKADEVLAANPDLLKTKIEYHK